MKDVKQISLERAINTLTALQCQFKVITTDGQEFGQLLVVTPPKIKRRPVGVTDKQLPIDDMQIGDVRIFKPDEKWFKNMEELRTSLSKHLWRKFGSGCAIVEAYEDHVEVLRIK